MTITNGYITAEEFDGYTGGFATSDTAAKDQAITAASRWIDQYCGRFFYSSTAQTMTFRPDSGWAIDLGCDLVSVTTLKTDAAGDGTFETTWSTSDYQLLTGVGGYNSSLLGEARPYRLVETIGTATFPVCTSARRDTVQIVGTFGWAAVPAAVKQACLLSAHRLLTRKDAPFGIVAAGDLAFRTGRKDDDVVNLLQPYRLVSMGIA